MQAPVQRTIASAYDIKTREDLDAYLAEQSSQADPAIAQARVGLVRLVRAASTQPSIRALDELQAAAKIAAAPAVAIALPRSGWFN